MNSILLISILILGVFSKGNIHEARRLSSLTKEEFCDELHKAITSIPEHKSDDDEYTDKYCNYIIEEHELEKDDFNDIKDIPYFIKHYKIYKKNEKEIEKCNKNSKTITDHGKIFKEHCGDSKFTDKDEKQLEKLFLKDEDNNSRRLIGSTSKCNILSNNYFDTVSANKANNVLATQKCGQVYDQGNSNACWAFASAEQATCNFNNKRGTNINFAVQQVLDCTPDSVGTQQSGGWPSYVSNYMAGYKGYCESYNYVYKEAQSDYNGYCNCNKPLKQGTCYGFRADDFTRVTKAVAAGPQYFWSGVFYVDYVWFNTRGSNIIPDNACTGGSKYLHAVLIAGQWYGSYLLIQNTWGTTWGENGYAWMTKKVFDQCRYKVDSASKMNYIFMNYNFHDSGNSAIEPELPIDNENNALKMSELLLNNNEKNIITKDIKNTKLIELSYISIGLVIGIIFGGLCVAIACGLMIYCIFIKNKVNKVKYTSVINDSDTDDEV